MPENENAPVEQEETPKVEAPAAQQENEDTTDWKAESRKWERLAKANKAVAEKAASASGDFTALESRIKQMEEENLNLKKATIGAKYGLSERIISSLKGSTPDEIENDAKGWAEEFKAAKPAANKTPEAKKNVALGLQGQGTGAAPSNKISSKEDLIAHLNAQKS